MVGTYSRNARFVWVFFLFAIALVIIFAAGTLARESRFLGERILFYLAPSAERAYAYGSRHFDARNPDMYDIEKARRYFERALAIDATYPYVQHQLARIAFLRGDLERALARINLEIENSPSPSPSSYYVRGLIEGYMGRYEAAIADYERYLEHDPNNWAALNDYAWVLLKSERFDDAAGVTARALLVFPQNPWLLNSHSIALYELGDVSGAYAAATMAVEEAQHVSEQAWLTAYPGNDPRTARSGIETLIRSTRANMHTIELARASSTLQ